MNRNILQLDVFTIFALIVEIAGKYLLYPYKKAHKSCLHVLLQEC